MKQQTIEPPIANGCANYSIRKKLSMMKKKAIAPGICLILFLLLIVVIKTVDVQAIGPEGTSIGLAGINGAIHDITGVHLTWHKITDYLGLLSIVVAVCFACLGFIQLIKRKSLLKVDREILVLGCLYVILAVLYVLFEFVVINERPIIMPGDEHAEASFPSSHTMLGFVILGSCMTVLHKYVRNDRLCGILQAICGVLILIMVFGRLISGVHWFTDILGGILLSAALLFLFVAALDQSEKPIQE